MENKIYIFGHRNPDTDSVTSAIALSYLKNQLGYNTEPAVLSSINQESKFVLNYFNVKTPIFLNDVKLKIEMNPDKFKKLTKVQREFLAVLYYVGGVNTFDMT